VGHYYIRRPPSKHPKLLELRRKYRYRLTTSVANSPRPETLSAQEFDAFARYVMPDGVEWLFSTHHARELFVQRYGGTKLGE